MTTQKKKFLTIALTLLIIIALAIHHHKKILAEKTKQLTPPVLVRIAKPTQKLITQSVTTTASLVAEKSTTITPSASGYIRAISFHEGQTIKAGQMLFRLDSQTQQDAFIAAQAADALSQVEYDRDATFLKKGFITQDMYYSAKATLKQNQAQLQTAKTNLRNRTITAPFDGTVGAISVSLGDLVNPGSTLTTLVDNTQLRVEYALPVKYLNQLQLNQAVIITDTTKKNKIIATVSYIAPAVDLPTQTIAVHAIINNPSPAFKPGEYVTVTQHIGSKNNALLVPEQSVLSSIDGYHVFIVKNNKAIKTPVKMGERKNNWVVITNGLTANDDVITAGMNEVKAGEKVSTL